MSKTNQTLRLILASEFGEDRVWEFTGPRAIIIGRDAHASINLSDDNLYGSISRYHAVIELSKNRAIIRDLGSLNGTFVNGHLVGKRHKNKLKIDGVPVTGSGVALSDGDLLTIGTSFNFRVGLFNDLEEEKTSSAINEVNPFCPGCKTQHNPLPISRYADVLCDNCAPNPLAALKLLKAGLARRVKSLSSLRGLKIISTLGRGSTSAVFLAVKKDTNKKMAIKIMPPSVSKNDWARKSFLREVAIGRALKHPNVVTLYEFGFYGGAYYYLMEYCPGGNSEELRLKEGGTLDPKIALKIILPVLDGLDYLHHVKLATAKDDNMLSTTAIGLVHRDLKPANIFLGGEELIEPKIADLGVGKIYGTQDEAGHTKTGSVAGSPATMPRQEVTNFKYSGPEVDIWAAAASLFKLLTGSYPRNFPENQDPWQVVLNSDARPILSVNPSVPTNLAKVIDLALIDKPKITYQKAIHLKEALMEAARQDKLIDN